jgi:phytol kinase
LIISLLEVVVTVVLLIWGVFVINILTKYLYRKMEFRGFEHYVAVYYNRKVIHILAGGICAAVVPFFYQTPLLPLIFALLLAIYTYVPHKTGNLMWWFQTEDNICECTFAFMWGIVLTLGWIISGGNFWLGVLPLLFMSVGDALTGIVRNILYKTRTKSWWGNVVMGLFSIPLGAILGIAGMLAGAIVSVIEHFEFGPIDDNITVPAISFLILIIADLCAPWLLSFSSP